jgi:hypothetical protein
MRPAALEPETATTMTEEMDFQSHWNAARSWAEYLENEVREHRGLWEAIYARAVVPAWAVERAARIGGVWRLLVIAEDWCGDASNTVPVVARLAEALPNVTLRVVKRDENPALMDRFLTGGARSIPVVVGLRDDFTLAGWWGPRPAELQAWVVAEKRAGQRDRTEIYRDVRRWYARDRGESTLREVLAMLAGSAAEARAATAA